MQFFQKKIITPFMALLIAVVVGAGTWGVITIVNTQASTGKQIDSIETQYTASVTDAMTAENDEIRPLIDLVKEDPLVTWDEKGERVLLLSWHKYPDSYVDGSSITLDYGPVWTFTDKEITAWYKENKNGITDWDMRLRQLIGLKPDSQYTHMTAFWASPNDIVRPAYCQDITHDDMATSFQEEPSDDFHTWFNGNIISSYYEGAYPWTRLGYTYDWGNKEDEYGLTEFLIKEKAPVTIEFTKTTEDFIQWMENGGK